MDKNNYNSIHETYLRDIVDLYAEAKKSKVFKNIKNFKRGSDYSRSISSRAEGSILVFPVITSKSLDITHASMVSKAMERYASTILNIALSTMQLDNSRDALDYISKFHTNLDVKENLNVDEMMHIMNKIGEVHGNSVNESSIIYTEGYANTRLKEDMNNLNNYLKDPISENSISKYRYLNNGKYGNKVVTINEDLNNLRYELDKEKFDYQKNRDANSREEDKFNHQTHMDYHDLNLKIRKDTREVDLYHNNLEKHKWDGNEEDRRGDRHLRDKEKHEWDSNEEDRRHVRHGRDGERHADDLMRNRKVMITDNLRDNDVRKANELIPTTMVVNYYLKDETGDGSSIIPLSFLIGIKAKLYPVGSVDIIERVTSKVKTSNGFQRFIKATTREISFMKDFMFAIEQAKVDAISRSRRGSSSKLWKVLERRATKNNYRRAMGSKNDASPISTLCISQEEVEYVKKEYNINLESPGIARGVMESYNLMCFCIVDEVNEVVKFLFDTGDGLYENYSFNSLERENSDKSGYKNMVNLISKMK